MFALNLALVVSLAPAAAFGQQQFPASPSSEPGSAVVAEAQNPSKWTRKIKVGKALFVTTVTGEEIAGKAGPVAPGT